jgi:hypothetical protein
MFSTSILQIVASDKSNCVVPYLLPAPVIAAYIVFGALATTVYHFVAEGEFSSVLTLAVIAQAMAICFLCVQVIVNKSVKGISVGALVLDGLSVAFRMPSTTWSEGYLPMDKSGDYLFQTVDFFSLMMIMFLLHRVKVVNRSTYESAQDTFNVGPVIFGCIGLAAMFHGNAADNPLYDTCWMGGLFCGVAAVLPKLWLIQQTGGWAEALTCHYIAAMGISRAMSGLFMWEARDDVTCDKWHPRFDHGIVFILGAHAVHLLLLADFAWVYMKAALGGGCSCTKPMQLKAPVEAFSV